MTCWRPWNILVLQKSRQTCNHFVPDVIQALEYMVWTNFLTSESYLIEKVAEPSKNRVGMVLPEPRCTCEWWAWWCDKFSWGRVGGREAWGSGKLELSGVEPGFGGWDRETRERDTDEAADTQEQKFMNKTFVNQEWLISIQDGGNSGHPQRCGTSRNEVAFLFPDLRALIPKGCSSAHWPSGMLMDADNKCFCIRLVCRMLVSTKSLSCLEPLIRHHIL